jgi:predicted ABC-type transport system involved in lysophospholipase L1 biosynthesis ATPase subunit
MINEEDDDADPLESTTDCGNEVDLDPSREIGAVLDDLEALLKNGEVIGVLSAKGVNASLALVAIDGIRRYLEGKKAEAAEDFATVAEEIRARLAASSREPGSSGPSA